LYYLDIDTVRHPADGFRITIDNHHILVFLGKPAGDMKTHFTRADNDHFQ